MAFTENEILDQLDLAFEGRPNEYYPAGKPGDIKYNFFLDLEHGYFETAGSYIHLYADSLRWAIVFEKNGYGNRSGRAEIELIFVGNCVTYEIATYPERNYITNSNNISLTTNEEIERIRNKEGADMETFELISPDIEEVIVHGKKIRMEHDPIKYEKLGIKLRDYDNPKKLIGYSDFIRYLHETNPSALVATEDEIKQYLPPDLPKIMTLTEFHAENCYEQQNIPSTQETYQLIAKVLKSGDSTQWKPTQKANNNWRNWNSGFL